MATLHVRNIPENLHKRIRRLAQARNHSLSAEVVSLLNLAVKQQEIREAQGELLAEIRNRRFRPPKGTPDSVELLREDRDR